MLLLPFVEDVERDGQGVPGDGFSGDTTLARDVLRAERCTDSLVEGSELGRVVLVAEDTCGLCHLVSGLAEVGGGHKVAVGFPAGGIIDRRVRVEPVTVLEAGAPQSVAVQEVSDLA